MGKIVMPKNSALLNEIESVLQIYYEANDWLPNDVYKQKLKAMIGDTQYSSSYTKKAQITSYFGFTIWKDFNNRQSHRKITESGKGFYLAVQSNNQDAILEELMCSFETVKFGRENCGVSESDSDVEPPSVFIRAALELDYLTYKEFAYILWSLEDKGGNFTDTIAEISQARQSGGLNIPEAAQKYTDAKPIMILVRWGFLAEGDTVGGARKIMIAPIVLDRYRKRLSNLKIYNIDMDMYVVDDITELRVSESRLEYTERVTGGSNILLYGVPGAGKSYTIEHEYCDDENRIERLVFHPDYTYSDFVGQILPNVSEGIVSYEFTEGPFTRLLKNSYENPGVEYFLIIEEINRGNAPAIFGEVFQLLDRDENGTSEYGISNSDIARVVYGVNNLKVRIPSNMSIIGTMNTSDQNVFTLDTAFQRRWNMRMIENDMSKVDLEFSNHKILDTEVSWKQFNEAINTIILRKNVRVTSSEDKRLGAYFVRKSDLQYNADEKNYELPEKERLRAERNNSLFADKVLKYLWDDAFKFTREDIFETSRYISLEDIVKKFKTSDGNERFAVFKEEIFNLFISEKINDEEI
ncbi:McrB family protein [Sporosarcina sp. PTS2304]|uniref:McrB family protein n=1 Tax=Sporosarcina sp. PTS2304 TaxID=2283194 RepID=UPI001965476A|nr:AAA family ATPase [Sporosarcina sp. PTS2304]